MSTNRIQSFNIRHRPGGVNKLLALTIILTTTTYISLAMESFNNSSVDHSCESSYTGKLYLHQPLKDILIALMVITMILNICANSAVIYALVRTEQLYNLSLRLVLFLCVSDCCLALFGQPLYIVMLANFSGNYYCNFDAVVEFFIYLFCHTSAYIIGLIGYDRFFRIKYLNRYQEVIKSWKVYVAMVTSIFLSFLQTSFQIFGIQHKIYRKVKMACICIDFVIISMMILPYVLSIRVIRKHSKHTVSRNLLKKVDNTISSIASRIMVTILILYSPYITFEVLLFSVDKQSGLRKKQWLQFGVFLGYQLAIANSFVNAVIFISFNKKSRSKLLDYFQTYECICNVFNVPRASGKDTLTIRAEKIGELCTVTKLAQM